MPLFLISVLDFINKIKEKANGILLAKINLAHADYREAKAIYNNIAPYEEYDKEGKVQGWRSEVERHSDTFMHNHLVDIQIEKYFKWFLPVYTICIFFLFFSVIFAQYPEWISFNQKINADALTLWTFVLLLSDITYTDFFANKLIALVEYQKKKRTQ